VATASVAKAKALIQEMAPEESREVLVELLSHLKQKSEIIELLFSEALSGGLAPMDGPELTYEELDRRRARGLAGNSYSMDEAFSRARARLA
jgi:hypothetical protein